MNEFDEIEKIDISKILRPNPRDLMRAILDLQVKVNEIIDVLNMIMNSEDGEILDEDPIVISEKDLTI